MKKHMYRITVEALGPDGGDASAAPLQFEVSTHEDLFAIIQRIEAKEGFVPDIARPFGVGLKLFSEIVREHKEMSPFSEIIPHLASIMKEVKKPAKNGAQADGSMSC